MKEADHSQVSSNEPMSPLKKSQFQSKLRLQNKLSLDNSTVHLNIFEEKKKMT